MKNSVFKLLVSGTGAFLIASCADAAGVYSGMTTSLSAESGPGMCVDVTGYSTVSGGGIEQWSCLSQNNQLFKFVSTSDGFYQIRPLTNSGLCLDYGANPTVGNQVVQKTCAGMVASQKWAVWPNSDNSFTFSSADSQGCLNVVGQNSARGALINTSRCADQYNQAFMAAGLKVSSPMPSPKPSVTPVPTPTPTPVPITVGVTARRAFKLVDSLGINTHIVQGQPEYSDVNQVAASINYLGFKHMRESFYPGIAPLLKPLVDSGIKQHFIVDGSNLDINSNIAAAEEFVAAYGVKAMPTIEGPNEINLQPVTYNGQTTDVNTTFLPAAQGMHDLYAAIHSNPNLSGVQVYDVTYGGAEPDNVGLQFLSGMADFANVHVYPAAGHQPEHGAEGDTLSSAIYSDYIQTWGTTSYAGTMPARKVLTETGAYTIPVGAPDDGAGTVTQNVKMKMDLNMALDAFKQGYNKTFYYVLYDESGLKPGSEGYYGMFYSDFTPKPAATALHNLTTILGDTAASAATFTPGKLNYLIPNLPSTAASLLFQKSNGSFDLVIWDEQQMWDPATLSEITPPTEKVTVQLGQVYSSVKVYDPTKSASPIQSLTNVSAVSLGLTDHALIVEVK